MQAQEKIKSIEESSNKSQLPEPMGWRILVAMPEADKKTDGGIIKAQQTLDQEEVANICGYVLKMGDDCYQDKKRFPNGPWCKKGDWIIFGRYAGARIKIDDGELRLLNDDEILATIQKPEDILHMT